MMKVGDKVKRKIYYGAEYGGNLPPEEGIVVFIHPQRRFYTLEFTFPLGKIRESYPLRNRITQPVFEPGRRYIGPQLPNNPRISNKRKGKFLNHI